MLFNIGLGIKYMYNLPVYFSPFTDTKYWPMYKNIFKIISL